MHIKTYVHMYFFFYWIHLHIARLKRISNSNYKHFLNKTTNICIHEIVKPTAHKDMLAND